MIPVCVLKGRLMAQQAMAPLGLDPVASGTPLGFLLEVIKIS